MAAEVVMEPSGADREQFAVIFIATALFAGFVAWGLPRWSRRATALRRSVGVLSGAIVLVVAIGIGLSGRLMFLSSHDLELLWVVLGFALALGLVLAVTVPGSMTRDLEEVASTARRVGTGERGIRAGVIRNDEIGATAAAFDDMLEKLEAAEAQRDRDDESRRNLLAAIGHDLRTPLSALQAAVEALEDGVAPDPERYLRSMRQDVATLAALVDDLFVLARLESGDVELDLVGVDLAELADEAVEVLEPSAHRRDVELRVTASGRVPAVGSPEALGRVIRNLVDNAVRHAPPGTEVVVEVGGNDGGSVTVLDDGPGFSPDFIDRAFVSFERADPARGRDTGGAGLGLAIAHGFVQAHGGEIWAEQGPGGRVG
ncbi:MAG: HAMP domain-containing protein, partial [Actinobacteria bacterium]|nr:HAMP domain-containing histidine kinase [Actinomycetota bacterium]NIT95319.1 HAMP domain-containing histidine kinase [Actinomycetota bacterium]NIU68433.1 HAMP domain-containing histidine kinase [Actinomycetota bacterium]NIX22680.1 HAMP domain-containing protein [Actinomycetota bacterium]NIX50304.1 HAMP domain-containing protein [Actinomycetota bacterium]